MPNTVIQSATFNAAMDDIAQTFNTPVPQVYGGTGGVSPASSRTALGAFGVVKSKAFTASGTYVPDPNLLYAIIELVGAGGGGGACTAAAVGQANGGGGAGAGAYAWILASKADIGASQPVTIGAPGIGGAPGNNPGTGGGTTSVGTLATAVGGNGANGATAGTAGAPGAGGATGTGVLVPGQSGTAGSTAGTLSFNGPYYGGKGGDSHFGFGGSSTLNTNGLAPVGYGAGGGGGSDFNATSARSGANGSAGFVRIIEFCSE